MAHNLNLASGVRVPPENLLKLTLTYILPAVEASGGWEVPRDSFEGCLHSRKSPEAARFEWWLKLRSNVNADRDVVAALLAIGHISIGIDFEFAVDRRVLVDLESHCLGLLLQQLVSSGALRCYG